MSTDLAPALRTAGFALAHAIGSIRFGGTLCTLAIFENDGERILVRYEAENIPASVANAHAHLGEVIGESGHGVLVYDGFMTPANGERSDALIVEILGPKGEQKGHFIQGYRPARRFGLPIVGRGCTVLGAPFIDESIEDDNAQEVIYDGVRDHPFGARLFGLSRK